MPTLTEAAKRIQIVMRGHTDGQISLVFFFCYVFSEIQRREIT